jgi:hypothetical protein
LYSRFSSGFASFLIALLAFAGGAFRLRTFPPRGRPRPERSENSGVSAESSDDDSSTGGGGAGAIRVELLVVLAGSLVLPLAAIGLDATGIVGELGDDGDAIGGSADVDATGVSVAP